MKGQKSAAYSIISLQHSVFNSVNIVDRIPNAEGIDRAQVRRRLVLDLPTMIVGDSARQNDDANLIA